MLVLYTLLYLPECVWVQNFFNKKVAGDGMRGDGEGKQERNKFIVQAIIQGKR